MLGIPRSSGIYDMPVLSLSLCDYKYASLQAEALRDMVPSCLLECMEAPYPTVRAAAAYGLSSFFSNECYFESMPTISNNEDGGCVSATSIHYTEEFRLSILRIALSLANYASDASPLVRKEIALALGVLVSHDLHLETFAKIQQQGFSSLKDNAAEKDKGSSSSIPNDDLMQYAGRVIVHQSWYLETTNTTAITDRYYRSVVVICCSAELWKIIKRLKDDECISGVVKAASDVVNMVTS